MGKCDKVHLEKARNGRLTIEASHQRGCESVMKLHHEWSGFIFFSLELFDRFE